MFGFFPVLKISKGFRNSQSCEADSVHMNSSSILTLTFIFHENIHLMLVETLSAEELGTMSKNRLPWE